MIAQIRPEVARIAEETVLNLKELESRFEVLRNDFVWLCQSIGHPEAARWAATPVRSFQPVAPTPFANAPFGNFSPSPFASPGLAPQFAFPQAAFAPGFPTFAGQPFPNPYANPFYAPYAFAPGAPNPYASHPSQITGTPLVVR